MANKPEDIVPVLYGSETYYKNAVAFCKFHHCHLTARQVKQKGCLGKQCKCLDRIETHPYWEQRKQKKIARKHKGGVM